MGREHVLLVAMNSLFVWYLAGAKDNGVIHKGSGFDYGYDVHPSVNKITPMGDGCIICRHEYPTAIWNYDYQYSPKSLYAI